MLIKEQHNKRSFFIGLLIIFLTWGTYFIFIWSKVFKYDDTGLRVASYMAYDWPVIHLPVANIFAYQPINNWFKFHPLYYKSNFSYHFLADAISGILLRLHLSYFEALILPSILTTTILLLFLYIFYYVIFKSAVKSLLAATIFLTSGGLAFLWFFKGIMKGDSVGSLIIPTKTYPGVLESGINWTNIPLTLISQRAFLLGMPIALFITIILLKFTENEFKNVSNLKIIALGIFSSILLLAHTASYLVLIFFCLFLLFFNLFLVEKFLIFGVSAAIPSIILYKIFYSPVTSPNFFSKFFIWDPLAIPSFSSNKSFYVFWFMNWGIFFILILYAFIDKNLMKSPVFWCGFSIFILSNLIQFQPYGWDNMKYLVWSYLLLTLAPVNFLEMLWNRKLVGKFFSVIFFIVLTLSGSLELIAFLKIDRYLYLIFSHDEENLASDFKMVTEPDGLILSSGDIYHWVTMLSGRRIVMGDRIVLSAYGIDSQGTEEDIKKMFAGEEDSKKLLEDYKIKYVVIGPLEVLKYGANEDFFRSNYKLILNEYNNSVYQIY